MYKFFSFHKGFYFLALLFTFAFFMNITFIFPWSESSLVFLGGATFIIGSLIYFILSQIMVYNNVTNTLIISNGYKDSQRLFLSKINFGDIKSCYIGDNKYFKENYSKDLEGVNSINASGKYGSFSSELAMNVKDYLIYIHLKDGGKIYLQMSFYDISALIKFKEICVSKGIQYITNIN